MEQALRFSGCIKMNIDAILAMSDEEFAVWYETLCQQDSETVLQMLDAVVKEFETELDTVQDLSLAQSVLSKFTLKGEM